MIPALSGAVRSGLHTILEDTLSRDRHRPVRVAVLGAKPLGTYSTHPIYRLTLVVDGTTTLQAVFKQLRPEPFREASREIITYRRVLPGGRFGAPRLLGSRCDMPRDDYWLLLEDVGDERLDYFGAEQWGDAFAWMARLHASYYGRVEELRAHGCLEEHDERFYYALAARARDRVARRASREAVEHLDDALGKFRSSVAYLAQRPRTLLHGDASCKNLMVQHGRTVRAVDWEWAAIGVPAWDLAKLLSGWGERKPELIAHYLAAFERHWGGRLDPTALRAELRHCEILKFLWYLWWWTDRCDDPSYLHGLLDRIAVLSDRGEDDA